ncbi:hypothetical protein HpHA286_17720 [Helicobacter pylori]
MLAAYGAYTGVGMLASTAGGVAIAELSGVAATNVTLAWRWGNLCGWLWYGLGVWQCLEGLWPGLHSLFWEL